MAQFSMRDMLRAKAHTTTTRVKVEGYTVRMNGAAESFASEDIASLAGRQGEDGMRFRAPAVTNMDGIDVAESFEVSAAAGAEVIRAAAHAARVNRAAAPAPGSVEPTDKGSKGKGKPRPEVTTALSTNGNGSAS